MDTIGINPKRSEGATPDQEVNQSYHYDLSELAASQILKLAHAVAKSQQQRVLAKRLKELINQAIANHHIDPTHMSEEWRRKFIV
jgi:hypothetical protein